jgi:ABC-type cobalamin/Fe3+-siderophores transport system ATPase subunit
MFPPSPAVPAAPTPRLAALALSFAYGGRDVLRSVSLALAPGELVGLLGPNGSGKTTLLRCLLGYLPPRSGRVTLDGANVADIPRRSFARSVAAVPQEMPTDFPLLVQELVLLGRLPHLPARGLGFERASDIAAADAALAACGVAELAGRPLHQLSGGELRRAYIARALAQQAPVLLLDEPTAGLDLYHQVAIVDLLRAEARAGRAVLAVLHDLGLAARCDRVVVLDRGAMALEGHPDEVLAPESLSAIFGLRLTTAVVANPGSRSPRRFVVPGGA